MVLCDKCKIETNKIFDDLFCKKCHDARIKHESYLRNKERREAEKRKILPDPRFNDLLVARFINSLLKQGKKKWSI